MPGVELDSLELPSLCRERCRFAAALWLARRSRRRRRVAVLVNRSFRLPDKARDRGLKQDRHIGLRQIPYYLNRNSVPFGIKRMTEMLSIFNEALS